MITKGRRGYNMLHCAASKCRLDLVNLLLETAFKDMPNVENDLGETPLHLAAGCYCKGKISSSQWSDYFIIYFS